MSGFQVKSLMVKCLLFSITVTLIACGGGGATDVAPQAKQSKVQGVDKVEEETYNTFSSGFQQPKK